MTGPFCPHRTITDGFPEYVFPEIGGTAGDDVRTNDATDTYIFDYDYPEIGISGGGSDTYTYARGDGSDIFDDHTSNPGETDRLVFTDIIASDVMVRSDGGDVILELDGNAADASALGETLVYMPPAEKPPTEGSSLSGIEQIQFADGTIWSYADMPEHVAAYESTIVPSPLPNAYPATSGNDRYEGTSGDDLIELGLGDDFADGAAGDDSYIYSRGDGHDAYRDNDGAGEKIVLHDVLSSEVSVSIANGHIILTMSARQPDGSDAGSVTLLNAAENAICLQQP